MSLDKSLKTAANLTRHRNVLKRNERINVLKEEDRLVDDQQPVGLPKIAHRKPKIGGKVKKKAGEDKEASK